MTEHEEDSKLPIAPIHARLTTFGTLEGTFGHQEDDFGIIKYVPIFETRVIQFSPSRLEEEVDSVSLVGQIQREDGASVFVYDKGRYPFEDSGKINIPDGEGLVFKLTDSYVKRVFRKAEHKPEDAKLGNEVAVYVERVYTEKGTAIISIDSSKMAHLWEVDLRYFNTQDVAPGEYTLRTWHDQKNAYLEIQKREEGSSSNPTFPVMKLWLNLHGESLSKDLKGEITPGTTSDNRTIYNMLIDHYEM